MAYLTLPEKMLKQLARATNFLQQSKKLCLLAFRLEYRVGRRILVKVGFGSSMVASRDANIKFIANLTWTNAHSVLQLESTRASARGIVDLRPSRVSPLQHLKVYGVSSIPPQARLPKKISDAHNVYAASQVSDMWSYRVWRKEFSRLPRQLLTLLAWRCS